MQPRKNLAVLTALMVALAGPAMARTHHHHRVHHATRHHTTHHTATKKKAAHAATTSNAAFIKKALEGDNAEIALGHLAQAQGHDAAVKKFGRTLASDHTLARKEALVVAKAHGVAATRVASAEGRAEYNKLKRMHGWAFDREFARYMVKDHRQDIADFQRQATHGDKSTRRFAQKSLPTLRKHLRMAEGLARG